MPMAARELGPGATPDEPASDPLDDLSKMGLGEQRETGGGRNVAGEEIREGGAKEGGQGGSGGSGGRWEKQEWTT